jgi:hypothetical protein
MMSAAKTVGPVKSLARILLLALVLGLFGFAAANNFWRPNVDHMLCTTGPGPKRCSTICSDPIVYGARPQECHVITSGEETILIVGGVGIVILAVVSAAPRRRKSAKGSLTI